MRKTIFANGEYYHIYNRGVDKREVFLNDFVFGSPFLSFRPTLFCHSARRGERKISLLSFRPNKALP
ncbi:MAG: hypothetical protein RBT74_17450, partial [Tenuifilaceae bacterium]|nr:hypothetical protein [Tenuifilaceae bacterium]